MFSEEPTVDSDKDDWQGRAGTHHPQQQAERVIVRPVILTDGPKTNAYRALVDPRDWTCGSSRALM